MINKILVIGLLLTLSFSLMIWSSCSSIPKVEKIVPVVDNMYNLKIDSDYLENPEEFRYAMNEAARKLGLSSYTTVRGEARIENDGQKTGISFENDWIQLEGSNQMVYIERKVSDSYFVMYSPGKTQVIKNMKAPKHFHKGRTIFAIVPPLGVAILTVLIIFL
jgi:hypothetical protein